MSEWKEVRHFPEYMVNTRGQILSWRTPNAKFMRTTNGKVTLLDGEGDRLRRRTCSVAKIVLEAFVSLAPHDHYAHHIDGDLENNRLENLVWKPRYVDVRENISCT